MSYLVSTSPHIKAKEDVPAIMRLVCLALVPAFAVGAYAFGWYALFVTALSVGACVATEVFCQRLRGAPVTIHDWSAVVTGLLLAAVIPPNVPWFIPVAGGVFAIAVAKHCFGGLGNNIWNPALLARAFLGACFAPWIFQSQWLSLRDPADGLPDMLLTLAGRPETFAKNADVITSATVLKQIQDPVAQTAHYVIHPTAEVIWQSFLGVEGGCIAEVSAVALLIGGLFLLQRKIVTWEIPIPYVLTVGLLAWVLPAPFKFNGQELYTAWCSGPWLLHLCGGGLMIGAFFMATDMVTSPISFRGRLIFGVGCGVLTILIRLYAGYPEGVCYSILIMNTCVPLIDAWTRPKKFGAKQPQRTTA